MDQELCVEMLYTRPSTFPSEEWRGRLYWKSSSPIPVKRYSSSRSAPNFLFCPALLGDIVSSSSVIEGCPDVGEISLEAEGSGFCLCPVIEFENNVSSSNLSSTPSISIFSRSFSEGVDSRRLTVDGGDGASVGSGAV